jgi:2-methylcitrate dehydratase PrpD
LADFIFALRHKKLPIEFYEKAKLYLLDTLGVALAASKGEPVDLIII